MSTLSCTRPTCLYCKARTDCSYRLNYRPASSGRGYFEEEKRTTITPTSASLSGFKAGTRRGQLAFAGKSTHIGEVDALAHGPRKTTLRFELGPKRSQVFFPLMMKFGCLISLTQNSMAGNSSRPQVRWNPWACMMWTLLRVASSLVFLRPSFFEYGR